METKNLWKSCRFYQVKLWFTWWCSVLIAVHKTMHRKSKVKGTIHIKPRTHFFTHFFHQDKTLKNIYTYFSATQKYLCEQIEQIFFPWLYIGFLPEDNFSHLMQEFFRLNVTERDYFIRIYKINEFLFDQI